MEIGACTLEEISFAKEEILWNPAGGRPTFKKKRLAAKKSRSTRKKRKRARACRGECLECPKECSTGWVYLWGCLWCRCRWGMGGCHVDGMSSGKNTRRCSGGLGCSGGWGPLLRTRGGPMGDIVTRDFSDICLNALITPYGL